MRLVRSELAELQQGKVDHYEVVKQYRRKDGKVIWGHSSVAQVVESRPKMFIGTMVDITESKRAQDAVEAARAELSRAARMNRFGTMTASIAHEINQPLAAIAANTARRYVGWQTPLPISMRRGQPLSESVGIANALSMWSRAFAPCSRTKGKIVFY